MLPLTVDLRALALLRIALGLLIGADVLIRWGDLEAFYCSDGALPASYLVRSRLESQHLDLYRHFDTPWGARGLFSLTLVFAASLALGYRTRLCTLVNWYLLVSLHRRNVLLLDAGDLEMRLVLFWSIFLPLGARWSLDARRAQAPLPRSRYTSVAALAYLLQVGSMYFFAAVQKTDPVWTRSGDALYYALSIDQYATALARWAIHHPDLLRPFSFLALALEYAALPLLLLPWRRGLARFFIVIALMGYHVCISAFLHFGLFQPICIAMLLGLMPLWLLDRPEEIEKEAQRPPAGALPRWVSWVVAALAALVLALNIAFVTRRPLPPALASVILSLALQQHWDIFTPHPLVQDGWFILEATRQDGVTIDLLQGGKPVNWDKPRDVAAQFPNERWRRYLQTLWSKTIPIYLSRYLWWEQQRWNRNHSGAETVVKMRLIFQEEFTQPPGHAPRYSTTVLRVYPSEEEGTLPQTPMQEPHPADSQGL